MLSTGAAVEMPESHLTEQEQEALRRCEAATEGPWHRSCATINTKDGGLVATLAPSKRNKGADSEFIAHARTDLPAALEALEEARGALRGVEREYQELQDEVDCEDGHGSECKPCLHHQLKEARGKLDDIRELTVTVHAEIERNDILAILRGEEGNDA